MNTVFSSSFLNELWLFRPVCVSLCESVRGTVDDICFVSEPILVAALRS